ncbi:MAG: PQQ-dependent sugar dehydrogenase [Elusimicrobia bacterium]|nr:PQQ-dependent sugar dehydrogenase [Elusimicrobiota bacterium]
MKITSLNRICLEKSDPRYASLLWMNADGSGLEIIARGIRNTVGFTWHPQTRALWLTDNGQDRMGDDIPPDELNVLPSTGAHFGFPYCHGKSVRDPKFGRDHACDSYSPPALELGAHVAALGLRFYSGAAFPARFRHQLFIAEHGSWDRSTPVGYRVMLVRFESGRPKSYESFAEGWLSGGSAWGRPVDVENAPDGSLLVSDDHYGAIYRISYTKP